MAFRNLSEGEVTVRSLQSILAVDFSEHQIDDGVLFIAKDGLSVSVSVNPDDLLIRFDGSWPTSQNDPVPERLALPIVNRWNSSRKFARASYSNFSFRLDYFLAYDGGVSAISFNESLGWFFAMSQAYQKLLLGEED